MNDSKAKTFIPITLKEVFCIGSNIVKDVVIKGKKQTGHNISVKINQAQYDQLMEAARAVETAQNFTATNKIFRAEPAKTREGEIDPGKYIVQLNMPADLHKLILANASTGVDGNVGFENLYDVNKNTLDVGVYVRNGEGPKGPVVTTTVGKIYDYGRPERADQFAGMGQGDPFGRGRAADPFAGMGQGTATPNTAPQSPVQAVPAPTPVAPTAPATPAPAPVAPTAPAPSGIPDPEPPPAADEFGGYGPDDLPVEFL